MARPTSGAGMMEPLPGTPEAKARLAAIIATMSGAKSIPEVCAELGICEARFHALRKEFLAGALGLLEKRPAGRKSAAEVDPAASAARLAELEAENDNLRVELEAARIRTEIAMVMPHLLKKHAEPAPSGAGVGAPPVRKKKRKRGK